MADNPFAKFAPTADPANPFAKFAPAPVDQGPSVIEDVAKTAGPSLLRGTLGAITTPGSLEDLLGKGVDWGFHKMAPETAANLDAKRAEAAKVEPSWLDSVKGVTGAWRNLFPTYGDTLKKVEDNVTGKMYEAKTPVGRGVQTGLEVLPSLATGGVASAIPKAVGAGAASELAGQAAGAVKDKLPEGWQPYAEPVARGAGAVVGGFTPAMGRRVVTPLPMADDQLATVNALRARDPNFPMTAGQATESPRLMALEARSPRAQNMADNQADAFTRLAMGEAGINGDFRAIRQGQDIGQQLGDMRRANPINSTEFANLNQLVGRERLNLMRSADRNHLDTMNDIRDAIRYGVMQNPGQPPLNMTGPRYENLRQRIQSNIDRAPTSDEGMAFSRIREGLDRAWLNSLPDDAARQAANRLTDQYANYNVLRNVPPQVGRQTLTPQEVKSAVGHGWGNAAANEGRGTLAPLADDASRVMTPHPTVNQEPPNWFKVAAAAAPAALAGGATHLAGNSGMGTVGTASTLGAILGKQLAPEIYNIGAGIGSRVVSNPLVQGYLGNQMWRPGGGSNADAATVARILMSPTQPAMLPPPSP